MTDPSRPRASRPILWHRVGLVLVALSLTVLWPRVSPEHNLWLDEVYTLQMVNLPVERVLDESAADFHPPGYTLALKAWMKAGRSIGTEPGVAWARSMNLLAWLALALGVLRLGSLLFGEPGSLLLLAALATSASTAVVLCDLRSYGFAFVGLTLAALSLTALLSECDSPPGHRSSRAAESWLRVWFILSATLSLWSHLLAAPALALLSATSSVLVVRSRVPSPHRRRWVLDTMTLLLPWILFAPWLIRIPAQIERLRRSQPDWMTPPTVGNLLRVFDHWIPWGRISSPSVSSGILMAASGALAISLPLTVFLGRRWRSRNTGQVRSRNSARPATQPAPHTCVKGPTFCPAFHNPA